LNDRSNDCAGEDRISITDRKLPLKV